MKRILACLLLLIFMPLPALAETIELTCKTSNGYVIPLTIDLEKMEGTWGKSHLPYDIIKINDDLVTMMREDLSAGGDILVVNRATGEYQRASGYEGCDQNGSNCKLSSMTQQAQCNRKVF